MSKRLATIPTRLLALTSVLFLPLFACRDARTPGEEGTSTIEGGSAMSLAVTTTAFSPGGVIPKGYTCDGADTSPDLSWSGAPARSPIVRVDSRRPRRPGRHVDALAHLEYSG